jgi:hypothetical protein
MSAWYRARFILKIVRCEGSSGGNDVYAGATQEIDRQQFGGDNNSYGRWMHEHDATIRAHPRIMLTLIFKI